MTNQFSTKQKLQYKFDQLMAAGAPAMIGMLALLSSVIIVISGLVISIGGKLLAPEGSEPVGFIEAMWLSLMRTLDAGTMGGDAGWGFRIVMLLLPTLGGVFVISALIGILSAAVEEKLAELRKGRSLVLESGHTVILGWSPQIFSIISEIVLANASNPRHVIAILADRDKVEMEDELNSRIDDKKTTSIICRSGSPSDPSDINVVSLHSAKSILILPAETDDPDFEVIKAILAITNHPQRSAHKYNIVTQLGEQPNVALAKILGKNDALSVVNTGDIIPRVIAQTSRQAGLSLIYTDLINFDGDEIYFKKLPQLTGMKYADTIDLYQDVCVMGVIHGDGSAELNPPMSYELTESDRLIVLAEDDSAGTLMPANSVAVQAGAIRSVKEEGFSHPEKVLFLGWNNASLAIMNEMDHYVRSGSTANIIASNDELAQVNLADFELANLRCHTQAGDTTSRTLLDSLNLAEYDHVIVQSNQSMDVQKADAHVLVTLLHLRDIQQKLGCKFNIVAEMLDTRNRDLASITKVDDFIVSNHLISMLMAQLSENPALLPVFDDLFNADGSEIYLKPAKYYIEPGVEVSFQTVVESARRLGETAIGYKLHDLKEDAEQNFGVVTNPNKARRITFSDRDKVIVLAE